MLRALGLPEAPPIATTAAPAPNAGQTHTVSFLQTLARAANRVVAPGAPASSQRPLPLDEGESLGSLAAAVGGPSPLLPSNPLFQGEPSSPRGRGTTTPGSLRDLIAAAARQEKIPPALLSAVVEVESGFQPRAVSSAGARGLTQLMPGTARSLGVADPFDPWQNLVGGARFLRGLIDRYPGNLSLAVAAYNAGPGAVDAAGGQIPPYAETRKYVRLVLAAYQRNLVQNQGIQPKGHPALVPDHPAPEREVWGIPPNPRSDEALGIQPDGGTT